MLSNAVQPPTTEHVYAQWQEREELSSMAPAGLLQEDNEQSLDVKEEESVGLMEPTSQNHFRSSTAVRLKGNAISAEYNTTGISYFFYYVVFKSSLCLCREKGPAFKS